MRTVVFAVPGDLATPTGGYAYDRRMIAMLPAHGWEAAVLDLGEGFPHVTLETRRTARARLAACPAGPIVIDGLALGVLPEAAAALCADHRLIALVHHPLALESGLSAAAAAALHESERTALGCAHQVIAVSAATARVLAADYAIPPGRLHIVHPGTDRVSIVPRARTDTVTLLAVGTVVPRKGYDLLIAALATLKGLPWRLVIAGDCSRSPETVQRLKADIDREGLGGRINLLGAVPAARLTQLYAASDLFVLPSRFEGYGMAYAEAIAHGVPVVGTRAGAIPDTVPSNAGLLVPSDDIDALAAALRRLIEHPEERERLAAGARAARFPSWDEQAARFARVLDITA